MMTLNNHYHYVEILSPWGFRKRFSSHIHTSNPNEQSVKKTFVCNCQHLAKAGDERMKWTMALDSFQWFFFFSNLKSLEMREGRLPVLDHELQGGGQESSTPLPLGPGSHFKGIGLQGKARACIYWPIFIYSLIPCKLVFFLKIKSKKAFRFLCAWTTSKQPYLLSLFLTRVAQHLWSWLNWFHS